MRRRFFILFLIVVFIITAVTVWLYNEWRTFLITPLNTTAWTYEIKPGQGIHSVAHDLEQRGFIKQAQFLVALARFKDLTNIKKGEYAIAENTLPEAFLQKLVKGDVIQYSITFIEGWTFQELLSMVVYHSQLTHTLTDLNPARVMQQLGYGSQNPEGLFFPDTYHFTAGYTDVQLLKRAYETMQAKLMAAWQNRQDTVIYKTPYEALIAASLIEKETALASEKPLIAGVIQRRLEKNMRLQIDSTVIYAIRHDYQGNITRADLKIDSPYNTYRYTGLPPTPISMPGITSISAALNPAAGDALYFVAKGDGSHYFSINLNEHNKAVRDYQLKPLRMIATPPLIVPDDKASTAPFINPTWLNPLGWQ